MYLWRLLLAVGLLHCGSGTHTSSSAATNTFIALESNFSDFTTWQKFDLGVLPAIDTVHPNGPRTLYVNALPSAGATSFPVGTIIVKTTLNADNPQTHAMVKRGGDFNSQGAAGWEWFDLTVGADNVPHINWRGLAPPSGEGYAAQPGQDLSTSGDCNTCHAGAAANDYVQSKPLQLH